MMPLSPEEKQLLREHGSLDEAVKIIKDFLNSPAVGEVDPGELPPQIQYAIMELASAIEQNPL